MESVFQASVSPGFEKKHTENQRFRGFKNLGSALVKKVGNIKKINKSKHQTNYAEYCQYMSKFFDCGCDT